MVHCSKLVVFYNIEIPQYIVSFFRSHNFVSFVSVVFVFILFVCLF